MCKEAAVLANGICRFTTLLVKSQQAVCDRFCSHCIDGRSNPFRFIRNSHCVELSGDFLGSQFFCEVFYTGDFIFRIWFVGNAVQT